MQDVDKVPVVSPSTLIHRLNGMEFDEKAGAQSDFQNGY